MWWKRKKKKENLTPRIPAESFKRNCLKEVYWITSCIALGPFVDVEKARILKEDGINCIFNVGTIPPKEILKDFGFKEIIWEPIIDLARIPDEKALTCLKTFHRLVTDESNKLYIHCIAGQNRSPTIIWLYFVACGLSLQFSENLISRSSIDSIPGHPKMIDEPLIKLVQEYGKANFLPLKRKEILEPFF